MSKAELAREAAEIKVLAGELAKRIRDFAVEASVSSLCPMVKEGMFYIDLAGARLHVDFAGIEGVVRKEAEREEQGAA